MSNIFFSAGYCFSQEFLCILFSSRNQSPGYFFSEITHKPFKSQIVGHLNPPNICSVDRFWFAIISKAFWNNRGQNSLGERGGIPKFLDWMVYQILLLMVLRCTCEGLAMKLFSKCSNYTVCPLSKVSNSSFSLYLHCVCLLSKMNWRVLPQGRISVIHTWNRNVLFLSPFLVNKITVMCSTFCTMLFWVSLDFYCL